MAMRAGGQLSIQHFRRREQQQHRFVFDPHGKDVNGVILAGQTGTIRQRKSLLVERTGDLRNTGLVAEDSAR